jgi:hypothetical protein
MSAQFRPSGHITRASGINIYLALIKLSFNCSVSSEEWITEVRPIARLIV